MSLTLQIFTGLFAGILTGLFLGDYAAPLKDIGDIYVGLMQMTVLPYIFFSLIGNIGRLSAASLRTLMLSGLLVYLVLWAFSALTVLLLSQSFPDMLTSRFFSASMIEPPPPVDWFNLFVPSNPFHSLANNAVPAVVIFCLFFGVSLTHFETKHSLLEQIGLIAKTLHRVNGLVVRLTPIGLFAIAAAAAGTLSLVEVERLQGYYLAFGAGALIMTFIVLPLMASACTPFTYRDILATARNGLLTAFVTGSVLSVLPLLIEGVTRLFAAHARPDQNHPEFPEFVLPLAYPFPNSGSVLALIFIPFAAWFMGDPLDLGQSLSLLGLGFFLMFGKVFLAIPFLLDHFQIPQDMFQLFVAAGVLAGRLGDALSSMYYLVFTLLATAVMTGLMRVHWLQLARNLVIMAGALLTSVMAIHFILQQPENPETSRNRVMSRNSLMDDAGHQPAPIVAAGPNPVPLAAGQNRLERIRQRGILRVGVQQDALPYSYLNAKGTLVGFDIDLMRKLARDLGVGLEWVPYDSRTLEHQFDQDQFDVAVSGLTVTMQRSRSLLMTAPYLTVNMGLLMRDHQREDFDSEAKLAHRKQLRLGIIEGSLFEQSARDHFPDASIQSLEEPRAFFEHPSHALDALLIHVESGAVWSLLYPQYGVANPFPHPESEPLAIAVGGFDEALGDTLNTWITLQRLNGTLDRLFDYWIQGQDTAHHQPRWSILRNVLHWVGDP